ncbi:carboxylesterase/lipase family protein [Streptomyces sp. VRA16 Mangrove soil]|uniref:carboxylesterase/lipase family protein n=1 Tax=Streptomyces sp. VRA16 Mangrove soil TaxID=2817434 RepID=UPI001A9F71CD|nr:carboxylesterase family protein [Streptomyces sp. VRA16 Mangrove soil]MBO1335549.1 carboxylesterase/lipase family protein [Streptomyces sp. VRA16 Mangrove soil]
MSGSRVTALTTSGEVRGERLRGGVERYLGIPYAADPVGELRFRPPVRPAPWTGVRDARAASPAPPQGPDFLLENVVGADRVATDEAGCLTVNVWTPGGSTVARPVMVWVHGGAYVQGYGHQVWTDGARLAERYGVVVVSLNYRLGALGWLYVAELLGDAYAASANLGLQDQIAALAWVRDNIGRFGGDPRRVTVFGESAGGGSVAALLGAPAARPLLHRAILQSPPPREVHSLDTAREAARAYAGVLKEQTGSDDVRAATAGQLLAAQEELMARSTLGSLPFRPVVDGSVLPLHPLQALRNGCCAHIPVIAGTTEHEGRLFVGLAGPVVEDEVAAALAADFPDAGHRERADAVYRAQEGDSATARMAGIVTDRLFREPTDAFLDAAAEGGGRVWSYLFRERTPVLGGQLGSPHTLEIPYVFDVLDAPGLDAWVGDAPDQRLADAMSGAWAQFAHEGAPAHHLLPSWPRFTAAERATLLLGGALPGDPVGRVAFDPFGERRALWGETAVQEDAY